MRDVVEVTIWVLGIVGGILVIVDMVLLTLEKRRRRCRRGTDIGE
jgi:hypothetical protein